MSDRDVRVGIKECWIMIGCYEFEAELGTGQDYDFSVEACGDRVTLVQGTTRITFPREALRYLSEAADALARVCEAFPEDTE